MSNCFWRKKSPRYKWEQGRILRRKMRLTVIWEEALWTDGRTDTPSYRDATAHLKSGSTSVKPHTELLKDWKNSLMHWEAEMFCHVLRLDFSNIIFEWWFDHIDWSKIPSLFLLISLLSRQKTSWLSEYKSHMPRHCLRTQDEIHQKKKNQRRGYQYRITCCHPS